MKHFKNEKALFIIAMVLMLLPMALKAQQRNDDFFHAGDEYNDNRLSPGVIIGVMQNDNPTPLSSGLLILTVAGASYAIVRRRSNIKKGATLLLATLMLLGLTQCKKNDITPTSDGDTVFMALEASCGGGRTVFDPSVPGIKWGENGSTEYIRVGSSVKGNLGELSGDGDGNNAATSRLTFSGTITAPAGTEGEKLYFFYLGNGHHYVTSLDFSNQEGSAGTDKVTNYVIAIGEGTVTNSGGSTYTATADLEIKTAIAYFNVAAFSTGSDDDYVYLRGDDVYSTATIDYKAGTITGDAKGSINIGPTFPTEECYKYVALIPSVSTETTLIFEGANKEGTFTFPRGIQANRYYSNDGDALEITGKEYYVFTVSDDPVKVRFSPGNLQYNGSTSEWRFAEHQYETSNGSWNTSGWVDLFDWGTWSGTSEYWYPTNTSTEDDDYSWDDDVYFHRTITNHTATGWFTLSHDQWQYLFNNHTNGWSTVNGVGGYVIRPDGVSTAVASSYTASEWATQEAAGSVFLTAAGYRDGSTVNSSGTDGGYWSSTSYSSDESYGVFFDSTSLSEDGTSQRYYGRSVRLVRDAN